MDSLVWAFHTHRVVVRTLNTNTLSMNYRGLDLLLFWLLHTLRTSRLEDEAGRIPHPSASRLTITAYIYVQITHSFIYERYW